MHALLEASRQLIPSALPHPSLVLCSIPDVYQLRHEAARLRAAGVAFCLFSEPDIPDPLARETALATEPIFGQHRRLFRRWSLLQEDSHVARVR